MSQPSNPITPLTPQQVAKQEQSAAKEGYIKRDLIALDDLGAAVLLGDKNDETMSSDFARWSENAHGIKHEIGKLASEGLDLIQPDHGAKAIAGDLERAETVKAIEENDPALEK